MVLSVTEKNKTQGDEELGSGEICSGVDQRRPFWCYILIISFTEETAFFN